MTEPAAPVATEAATSTMTLPAVDVARYRAVMGRFVTGVTIVTSMVPTAGGSHPWGTTVNAFTSVSLDPPLVLVCIGRERSIHDVIAGVGRFAVNILAEESQGLSDCFAGAPSELPRSGFCGAAYHTGRTGVPILEAAVAHVECAVERVLDAGDHTIYLARVVELGVSDVHPLPLLYYRGRYLRIERAASSELLGKPDERYPEARGPGD
jgi:3-hydroxy-9,10-secoandrosta-1,3,5(10)-triene-9,17-dione monooxygenase reductase component